MYVGIAGKFIRNHQRKRLDVETSCSNVSRNEHTAAAISELHKCLLAFALIKITVQMERGNTALPQIIGQVFCIDFCVAENQATVCLFFEQQLDYRIGLVVNLNPVETLHDNTRIVLRFNSHLHGIALELLAQRTYLTRISRRKQPGAPVIRCAFQNVADIVEKAHIKHAIRFIKHHRLQR